MPARPRRSTGGSRSVARSLTISYWQLTDLRTGHPFASPSGKPLDWESMLARLTGTPNLAGDVSGRVYSAAGQSRLVLARDRAFAHRQRDPLGNASDMPVSAPGNEPIEEAFVSFVLDSNAFAFARTSIAAPQASAVASWLMNQHLPTKRAAPRVDPVIDNDRFQRARTESGARQANWVDIVAWPPDVEPDGDRSLFRQLFRIGSDVGNYKIEIKLSVDDDAAELRRQLFERAIEVADDLTTSESRVEHAQVKVLGEVGPIDLINDRIVYNARAKIELQGTNRSLSPQAVFEAMDRNLVQHGERIHRSLGGT
jgi:hypothetical protein